MSFLAQRIPYSETQYFSATVLDYINRAEAIQPFFAYPPSLAGIRQAIDARKGSAVNREVLVEGLKKQYESVSITPLVQANMDSLLSPDTFTITTAHQNNLFTGPLYFIYKILHAIRLAAHLQQSLPQYNFVPVFFIGSEDADLDELNHFYLQGQKLVWNTKQAGAVGRMKIDKELLDLVRQIEGQLGVQPHGREIVELIKTCYTEGNDLQTATFKFVNALFGEYGLVVFLPDNAVWKRQMISVFKDDLLHQAASGIVEKTSKALENAGYKAQASPRQINLFYLKDNTRERIEMRNGIWEVVNTRWSFTQQELLQELDSYPERFSPNVILRGLFQSVVLPDIAFIGGGGELAYWLQLKDLFMHYKTPFPVLVLRNSFLIVEKRWKEKIGKLGFDIPDFFLSEEELMKRLVVRESLHDTRLNGSVSEVEQLYESFKQQASAIDATLSRHVDALKMRAVTGLQELEKKMFRAEKRKFQDSQRQIQAIRSVLFPMGGLQERHENIAGYYARWGRNLLGRLYEHSPGLEQEFVILEEK